MASDTTSADNGGTIIVDAAGHRWHRDAQTGNTSVKWFGATGNGAADDTSAIQAAINVVGQAGGGTVVIPKGTYKISSPLNIAFSALKIQGSSRKSAIISTTSPSADSFLVGTSGAISYISITDLAITPSVTQTSGAAIHQTGTVSVTEYRNLDLTGNKGIFIESDNSSSVAQIGNCYIENCSNAGIYIGSISGLPADVYVSECNIASCGFGIYLENCAGAYFSQIDIILCTNGGVQFAPGQNEFVRFVFFDQVLADSSGNNGWGGAASGNGVIANIVCNACWAAGNKEYGIILNSGGTISGFTWSNGIIRGNGASGVIVVAGTDIIMAGNQIFNNGSLLSNNYNGISIGAGVSKFTIVNNISGLGGYDQVAGGTNQQAYGIYVAPGAGDHFTISNNVCYGILTGGVFNGATGSNVIVSNVM
jgi:hypothetical protein